MKNLNGFYNEITYFLDNYTEKFFGTPSCDNNYIIDCGLANDNPEIHVYVIRVPGATRGRILVDERTNKINFIEIYRNDKIYCYSKPYNILTEELQIFIGKNWNSLGYKERI